MPGGVARTTAGEAPPENARRRHSRRDRTAAGLRYHGGSRRKPGRALHPLRRRGGKTGAGARRTNRRMPAWQTTAVQLTVREEELSIPAGGDGRSCALLRERRLGAGALNGCPEIYHGKQGVPSMPESTFQVSDILTRGGQRDADARRHYPDSFHRGGAFSSLDGSSRSSSPSGGI